MKRETLTLRKPPDPAKIAQSLQIGFRLVDRRGRYILQVKIKKDPVHYHFGDPLCTLHPSCPGHCSLNYCTSWVDIPLVPETYGEAQS
jgi:hypothetical protein